MRKTHKPILALCCLLVTILPLTGFSIHLVQSKVSPFSYQVLFEDDFSKGMDKWSPSQGTWKVTGGELQGSTNNSLGLISAGDVSWTDYIFTVGFRSLSGSSVDVLARWQDPANYYKIVVVKTHVEVWLVRNGYAHLLYREPDIYNLDQTTPDEIEIKIHGVAPTISIYHSGYPEITVKDLSAEPLASGKIAFSVEAGTAAAYRNVKVTTLHADLVGPQTVVLLLVEFPDVKHTLSPEQVYSRVFPKLNQYYTEVSYNQTWIIGHVTPTWKMLQNPSTYYGLFTVTSPGWSKGRTETFLHDAIMAWDKEIDFTKYDYVFIAGAGDSIWGYTDFQVPLAKTDDGITITGATAQRETYDWTVYAHEFGHLALGLPDLYSYKIAFTGPADYRTAAIYVGPWDLMSRSNQRPEIGSWGKIHAGWIPDSSVLELLPSENGAAMIQPLEKQTEGIQAVVVYLNVTTYFIIENREPVGFDKVLPDKGILVSYVDESKYWQGNGPVVVEDAHPESGPRWQLPHPTFNIGPNAVSEYTNTTYNIAIDLLDVTNDSYIVAFGKPDEMNNAKAAYENAQNLLQEAQQLLQTTLTYQNADAKTLVSEARHKYAQASTALTRGSLGFFNQTIRYARDSINLLQKGRQIEQQSWRQSVSQTETGFPQPSELSTIAISVIAAAVLAVFLISYARYRKRSKTRMANVFSSNLFHN